MAIALLQDDYWSLLHEGAVNEPTVWSATQWDVTWSYPSQLGCGYVRDIYLREGLVLSIANHHLHHDLMLTSSDREHPIELTYLLAGTEGSSLTPVQAGHHTFCGSGMAPGEVHTRLANQLLLEVSIHIEPTLFCQWLNGTTDQVSPTVRPLIKPSDQLYYAQISPTTTAMQLAVQQILQCPFQDLTQRMYLESKVWELMALQLAQTSEIDCAEHSSQLLDPGDIERIHYAKEVLVSRLSDPPSLIELARIAGINDCKLKAGFRQVFGTTVFGYLHSCRMERSRQLLEAGEISVAAAAHAVGFANRSHFATAFRKKFGVNPSTYRIGKLRQKLR
ncbi:MAG: helix-turn-helix transcriptional regulator [Leptolyngbyaceae cyanobacterium SL_7_1]|nr:helix-turn-helix transcriptional regulator [Leptolyngbyaceae cyanobacterium SL_7_1]